MHPKVQEITEAIAARSADTRAAFLEGVAQARRRGPGRGRLSCGNLAHGFAAVPIGDKLRLRSVASPNLGIVTAYNDMLSAHEPYKDFPDILKAAAREAGATAQVAGGTPAMCDGVTQGRPGMELSLFSRDVIAMATGVALTHDMFDAALMLGICDKIVPGLFIGAMAFAHLPVIFVPGGPMPSGVSNAEKARVRGLHAQGKATTEQLLDVESGSYHSPGTCTFYGTANSNQMMMEVMGLHLPGAAFVHPRTPLRDALTRAAAVQAAKLAGVQTLADAIDERAIVNAIVGLLATGGSTNHTIHLVAMARAAGILINWDDFDALSGVTPLLARIYPNGAADVNQFHAAGGMGFLVRELVQAGLLHEDIATVFGTGLAAYAKHPALEDGALVWRDAPAESLDPGILRRAEDPFDTTGGLRLLRGGLGRAVIKVSAVGAAHRIVEAPARLFDTQEGVLEAFKAGELDRDVVVVVRFQGPRANGMPELHKLTPSLGVLQDRGYRVALVTDGRMSGASGKVPAAIHLTPEALDGGPLARLRDGDVIRLDAEAGVLEAHLDPGALMARAPARPTQPQEYGYGRELFTPFRAGVGGAEAGASVFF